MIAIIFDAAMGTGGGGGAPVITPHYVSTAHFVTGAADTPANQDFETRILDPGRIGLHAYSDGKTGGASKLELGIAVLDNTDGRWDEYLEWHVNLAGRRYLVYYAEPTGQSAGEDTYPAFPSGFELLFSGTMEAFEVTLEVMRIKLRDPLFVFDKPVCDQIYAGDNALPLGLEGRPEDLKGRRKPRIYGTVFNIPPPQNNTSKLIFQLSDRPIDDRGQTFDRAIDLGIGTPDYISSADMLATAPTAGDFRALLGTEAHIRLGATPDGLVTWGGTYTHPLPAPSSDSEDIAYRMLAVAHDLGDYLTIYEADDWSQVPNPTVDPGATGSGVAFSYDGTLLAVSSETTPFITIYNVSDFSKITNPAVLPTNDGYDCAFSHDGVWLAVSHQDSPRVTIYLVATWAKLTNPVTLPTGDGFGVAFSPGDSLLAVAHATTPFVTIYNTADWSKVTNPGTLPTGQGNGVTFNPAGTLMAVAHSVSPFVTIYNTSDWSKVTNPGTLPAGIGRAVAFSPDGTLLAVAHDTTPFVTIYTVATWAKLTNPSVLPDGAGLGVQFSEDGALLAIATSPSLYLTVYNVADWSKVNDPAVAPDGTGYAVAFRTTTLSTLLYDTFTGTVGTLLSAHAPNIGAAWVHADVVWDDPVGDPLLTGNSSIGPAVGWCAMGPNAVIGDRHTVTVNLHIDDVTDGPLSDVAFAYADLFYSVNRWNGPAGDDNESVAVYLNYYETGGGTGWEVKFYAAYLPVVGGAAGATQDDETAALLSGALPATPTEWVARIAVRWKSTTVEVYLDDAMQFTFNRGATVPLLVEQGSAHLWFAEAYPGDAGYAEIDDIRIKNWP